MSVIGELLVEINGDNSGLKNSLNQSTSETSKAIGQIVGAIGLASVAWKGMDAAIQGIKFNAMLESAQTSFGIMLGSVDDAKNKLKELKYLADHSPLTFAGVTAATTTLLQFGIAGDKVIPTVRMLGDVAGGNEERMQRLALAFAQISAAGRLQGQDLLQLVNGGYNPLMTISQKTGESMMDLRKRMEAGGISAQEVADAFQTATSKGGQFFGMMDANAKTLNGSFSTLSDATNTFLGRTTEAFNGPLLVGVKALTDILNIIPGQFSGIALTVVTATAGVGAFALGVGALTPAFAALGVTINLSLLPLLGATAIIAAIAASIAVVANEVDKANKNEIAEFKKQWGEILESSVKEGQTLDQVIDKARQVSSIFQEDIGYRMTFNEALKDTADHLGLTMGQTAAILANSAETLPYQKRLSEEYLAQNGLTSLGRTQSEALKENEAIRLKINQDLTQEMWKRYPDLKKQYDATQKLIEQGKTQKTTQEEYFSGMKSLNSLIDAGVINEKNGYEEKIKLRQEYADKLKKDFEDNKITLAFVKSETLRINDLNKTDLASLALKKTELEVITGTLKRQEEARVQYGQDAADKLQDIWDAEARVEAVIEAAKLADIKKKEDAHIQYGQDAADRLEKIWNAQKTPFNQIEIGLKSLMPKLDDVNDRWVQIGKDMGNALISVGKNGLEQIGRSLVDGTDAWKAWEAIGLEALAKVLEGLGAQLIALAAVNAFIPGMQGVAIAQGAAGAAALVAAGAMGAFASSLSSAAKHGEDAAVAVAQTATATDLLTDAVQRARNAINSTSDTSVVSATATKEVEALKKKYGDLATAAKDHARAIAESLNPKVKAEDYVKGNSTTVDIVAYKSALKARQDAIDAYVKTSTQSYIDAISIQLEGELDAIGYSLALFQDRAAQAGSSISSSLTSALTDGLSVTDFRKSIMDMLRKMAIDAAIIAGGFADKFKEIGNMVAEALKDGVFSETELAAIDLKVNALYSSATSAIQPLNDLFNKASSAQNITNNAGTTINIQTTNDPLTIANALNNVQQSLAYQGVVA